MFTWLYCTKTWFIMKKKEVIGLLTVVVVATLYSTESDPTLFMIEQSALFNVDKKRLFKFVTQPDTVPRWFQWVTQFRAADKRPISVGKQYQAVSQIPLYGEHQMMFRVVRYEPEALMVLESNVLAKPRIEITFETHKSNKTRLNFKMTFQRRSFLFQFLVGPMLYAAGSNELRNALMRLRMMFPY